MALKLLLSFHPTFIGIQAVPFYSLKWKICKLLLPDNTRETDTVEKETAAGRNGNVYSSGSEILPTTTCAYAADKAWEERRCNRKLRIVPM